jgi:hypothetical protein
LNIEGGFLKDLAETALYPLVYHGAGVGTTSEPRDQFRAPLNGTIDLDIVSLQMK